MFSCQHHNITCFSSSFSDCSLVKQELAKSNSMSPIKSIVAVILLSLFICSLPTIVGAEKCKPNEFTYGANEIVDQLMICSLTKSHDLDLTPQGEYVKITPKSLVEQGFSNKTTVMYAKLSGLWTTKRAGFVETGWKCDPNTTTVSSLIETSGLSLEIVEKVEVPLHRNQHKISSHKPCKTFNLPTWVCRQSKPIYRTTRTWINRAYFNLTLSQGVGTTKPSIDGLVLLFTCPETFRQKITYSPSAMYILSKYMQFGSHDDTQNISGKPAASKARNMPDMNRLISKKITHPTLHSVSQDGKNPATPPYHNSVNVIINQVTQALRTSISECIQLVESDLSLMTDYESFSQYKYKPVELNASPKDDQPTMQPGESNSCSNKAWIRQRLNLANEASSLNLRSETHADGYWKRSPALLSYPSDPNQLLNPFGYYHDNADLMIDSS